MLTHQKVVLAALLGCTLPAVATTPIQLKFEGLALTTVVAGKPSTPDVAVSDFYNGGTSKSADAAGTDVKTGPSLGVIFSSGAIATASTGTGGDLGTFNEQRTLVIGGVSSSSKALGTGAIYGIVDPVTRSLDSTITLNVAGGFNDLSFFYNASGSLEVSVRDAKDNLLASSTLSSVPTCATDGDTRCIWAAAALDFEGQATKVTFTGIPFDFLIDNITLGSLDPLNASVPPPPIPEPSTYALMALGLAAVGYAARRRRNGG